MLSTIIDYKKLCYEIVMNNIISPLLEIIDNNMFYINNRVSIMQFNNIVSKIDNTNIVLCRQIEVIRWLFGDLSFLNKVKTKNKTSDNIKYKKLEDEWGRTIMKNKRPDLKLDKQWTNKFGEYICEEIHMILGHTVSKPIKRDNYQPDLEINDAIIEVKTGTFYTSGTAGEKILGCPFKYAEIPYLYKKPLQIICIGGAEKKCREEYGNLPGIKCSHTKKKFLEFFKEHNIIYMGISDIIRSINS